MSCNPASSINMKNDIRLEFLKFVEMEIIPAIREIRETYLAENPNDTMTKRIDDILSKHRLFSFLMEEELTDMFKYHIDRINKESGKCLN